MSVWAVIDWRALAVRIPPVIHLVINDMKWDIPRVKSARSERLCGEKESQKKKKAMISEHRNPLEDDNLTRG